MIHIGCILAFLAVICGAFGAHSLEKILDEQMLEIWKTGAYYQMVHSLALIGLGLYEEIKKVKLKIARAGFLIGILLFSGSLYILALSGVKILGAITPFGGLAFLIGWLAFAWAANKEYKRAK